MASLKSLIDAIHAKNETENNNYKWLILIDEIQVFRHKSDLTTLHLKKDIEIMAAINPNGAWQSCITPPMDKRFIFQRLTFKHRNSLEISIFIAHWKYESRLLDLAYKFKDEPLLASSFPAIDKVILYQNTNIPHIIFLTVFTGFCQQKESNLDSSQ